MKEFQDCQIKWTFHAERMSEGSYAKKEYK